MVDTDGLFINGVWVMPGDRITTTYQSNDLSKPDTQQTNFSYSFKIPDSIAVRELLRNAEQLDSAERIPYTLLPAQLIDGGESVFNGFIRLSSFSNGWQAEFVDTKRDLYTRLDRSIRTLNLSRYDHTWSVETINQLQR